jgi:predicted CoA-binding protein
MPILDSDAEIRSLLERAHTIAVVGLSKDPERDSYQIGYHLLKAGYRIIPVNPAMKEVLGVPVVADLDSIKEHVDIVDIFRRPDAVPDVVDAAIRIGAGAVWMQLGTTHPTAVERASEAGLEVVPERCIMVEHRRLIR